MPWVTYVRNVNPRERTEQIDLRDGELVMPIGTFANLTQDEINGLSARYVLVAGQHGVEALPTASLDGYEPLLTDHIQDFTNPHETTAAQVGLGNVDDTPDDEKPVSGPQQDALDLKLNIADAGDLGGGSGVSTGDIDAAIETHRVDTTAVHGIADTSALVLNSDSRLSDARTPTAHTHPQSDVTGLSTALAASVQRANHTGTQTSATISDFAEAAQDAVAAALASGTGATVSYNDAANTITISAAGTSDLEAIRDAVGVALIGVGNITVTVDDAADTITISTTATANSTDAALRDRSTHTGTQAQSTVTGLVTDLGNLQPLHANLSAIAALATLTAFGKSLLTLADAAAARSSIVAAPDVQLFTVSGTWTKPAGAVWVDAICIGPGAGGAGGRRGAAGSARSGGGGGGGGGFSWGTFPASQCGATEAVAIGAAGAGGAAQTVNDTNGPVGSSPTTGASFGTGGSGGTNYLVRAHQGSGAPTAAQANTTAASGGSSMLSGGNGASSSVTGAANNGQNGGAGGGGGAGGSITTGDAAVASSAGGWNVHYPTNSPGGTAGAAGTAGTAGASAPPRGGGGGGGGSASTTGAAGAGGAGAFPGGGGGGGGASLNGNNSGAGGAGGGGLVVVITRFQ